MLESESEGYFVIELQRSVACEHQHSQSLETRGRSITERAGSLLCARVLSDHMMRATPHERPLLASRTQTILLSRELLLGHHAQRGFLSVEEESRTNGMHFTEWNAFWVLWDNQFDNNIDRYKASRRLDLEESSSASALSAPSGILAARELVAHFAVDHQE